ncbi:MAG: lysine--tRNA ligase [Myxococcota bacterium]
MEAGGGLDEILRVRKEKRERLRGLGWPPYPNGLRVSHQTDEVRTGTAPTEPSADDPRFRLGGRLLAIRGMGKAVFADLWDSQGKIQLQIKKDVVGDDIFAKTKLLDIGDIVVVTGPRFVTRRGELTLLVESIQLATKNMHPLPDKHGGLQDQELRYRQRYLDLIVNRETRTSFERRSALIRFIRRFLDDRQFLEVETPVLQSLLGGAAAKPFRTHHNALDMELYCRIAPELHLKRLVVGGFDRVYEVGRNFRNEGISPQHNPEFTMLEFYMAYATHEDLMALTETMFREAAAEVVGSTKVEHGGWKEGESPVVIDFEKPFRRLSVQEGLREKRPKLDLEDRAAIVAEARRLELEINAASELGKLHMDLFEALWEPELIQPTFVTDFPTAVSPLARRSDEDPDVTERFEVYVGGREIANGFSELNDPEDQRARFRDQVEARRQGDEESMDYDEDYCHALEVGLPPTAGEGVGIDRLAMLLTNAQSIRDVILFPLMRKST